MMRSRRQRPRGQKNNSDSIFEDVDDASVFEDVDDASVVEDVPQTIYLQPFYLSLVLCWFVVSKFVNYQKLTHVFVVAISFLTIILLRNIGFQQDDNDQNHWIICASTVAVGSAFIVAKFHILNNFGLPRSTQKKFCIPLLDILFVKNKLYFHHLPTPTSQQDNWYSSETDHSQIRRIQ